MHYTEIRAVVKIKKLKVMTRISLIKSMILEN